MKQIRNTPFLGEFPPVSTNSPISEQFFHDPLCPNFKNEISLTNIREGEETVRAFCENS